MAGCFVRSECPDFHAATLALTAIRLAHVSPNGATGAVLDESLAQADGSLARRPGQYGIRDSEEAVSLRRRSRALILSAGVGCIRRPAPVC
jgi:hypothetical protein